MIDTTSSLYHTNPFLSAPAKPNLTLPPRPDFPFALLPHRSSTTPRAGIETRERGTMTSHSAYISSPKRTLFANRDTLVDGHRRSYFPLLYFALLYFTFPLQTNKQTNNRQSSNTKYTSAPRNQIKSHLISPTHTYIPSHSLHSPPQSASMNTRTGTATIAMENGIYDK